MLKYNKSETDNLLTLKARYYSVSSQTLQEVDTQDH